MIRLKDLPHDTLLIWWAKHPSKDREDIENVIRMARMNLVDPKDLTLPKVRRTIRTILYANHLLPTHRRATDKDYVQAKERFISGWYDQDIV